MRYCYVSAIVTVLLATPYHVPDSLSQLLGWENFFLSLIESSSNRLLFSEITRATQPLPGKCQETLLCLLE